MSEVLVDKQRLKTILEKAHLDLSESDWTIESLNDHLQKLLESLEILGQRPLPKEIRYSAFGTTTILRDDVLDEHSNSAEPENYETGRIIKELL